MYMAMWGGAPPFPSSHLGCVWCSVQVKKRFPNSDTPLLIGDADGRTHAVAALEALDSAGYINLVGLKG